MTLHRTLDGWRINAGCRFWEALTVAEVCAQVKQNVIEGPREWSDFDDATRGRWGVQVLAALAFLAASVDADD